MTLLETLQAEDAKALRVVHDLTRRRAVFRKAMTMLRIGVSEYTVIRMVHEAIPEMKEDADVARVVVVSHRFPARDHIGNGAPDHPDHDGQRQHGIDPAAPGVVDHDDKPLGTG